jgi:hypothetical protein
LRNPFPENCFRKTESIFSWTAHFLPFEPFSVSPHFPFLESSVPCTEACEARAGER